MLKPRERNLLIATLIVVGGAVFYWFVGVPWWAARKQLVTQHARLVAEREKAKLVLDSEEQAHAKWAQIRRGGLKSDVSGAETQLVSAMENWSRQTGLKLSSFRRERASKSHDLQELVYQFTYTGGMSGVRGFLYRLETTDYPFRVRRLDLTATTESQDSLRLQLTLSVLCSGSQVWPAPTPEAPAPPAAPATQKGGQS